MSGVVTGNGGGTRAAPKSASGTTLPLSGAASVACVRGGRGTTTANEKDPSFAGAAAAGGAANGGIEGVAAGAMGGSGCMAGGGAVGGNACDSRSPGLGTGAGGGVLAAATASTAVGSIVTWNTVFPAWI